MADVLFKVRFGGDEYDVSRITLGDARILRKEFEIKNLETLDPEDSEHLAAIVFLALKERYPSKKKDEILTMLEAVDFTEFEATEQDAEEVEGTDPTVGATGAEAVAPVPASPLETTPVSPGTPA